MFIHIGHDTVVLDKEIIGIFDMDNTTVMKKTIDYLNTAEKEKQVIKLGYMMIPTKYS